MIAALITDTAFLDESLDPFRRLIVGLIDEKVGAVQVVPDTLGESEVNAFAQRVSWRESRWGRLQRYRLRHLADQLDELHVDIVHAFDRDVWDGALELAVDLETPLVLSASSGADVERARAIVHRLGDVRCAIAATTEPLTRALKQAVPREVLVANIPPGVHCPSEDDVREVCTNPDAMCAVVTGTGENDEDYTALFGALQPIVRDKPLSQFFLDGMGNDQHELWQFGRRLNLLSHMSTLPRQLGHREMLLQADIIIQPQPLGRTRSFILQAMANGIPVIAREDSWVDYLIDGRTARLVRDPTRDDWENVLRSVIDHADEARQLGRRAREWVHENRIAAKEVEAVIALYREISGASYQFPGPPGGSGTSG